MFYVSNAVDVDRIKEHELIAMISQEDKNEYTALQQAILYLHRYQKEKNKVNISVGILSDKEVLLI